MIRHLKLKLAAGALLTAGVVMMTPAVAWAAPPSITSVKFTGNTVSPTVTVNGHGFGFPPAAFQQSDSMRFYTNNGDDYGSLFWFSDSGHFVAGQGLPPGGSCVGIIIASWSTTQVVFRFGSAYDTFDRWYVRPADGFTVTIRGVHFGGSLQFSGTTPVAYVTNIGSGSVVPIKVAPSRRGNPIPAGTYPDAIAITPDGSTAYVASSHAVIPIDLGTNTAGTPIPVGLNPQAIAISPDGGTAYVVNTPEGTVIPIDLATNTAGSPIDVGGINSNPDAIAITPDGSTAYVANYSRGTVVPINLATKAVGSPVYIGYTETPYPEAIAITPDGTTAYVALAGEDAVVPIDLATNTVGDEFGVGALNSIAISPDGTTAFVDDWYRHNVSPIDLATHHAGAPIPVGRHPSAIAITPDGSTVYVANSSSRTVTPINIANGVPGAPISLGLGSSGFYGIAITPDQAPIARFTRTGGLAGSPVQFDASTSTVATGIIVRYAWTFGDGTSGTTTGPKTTHTYGVGGTYTVTLTETDSAGTSTARVFTGQTVSRNGGPSATTSHLVTVT